jgi:hypothetical protein
VDIDDGPKMVKHAPPEASTTEESFVNMPNPPEFEAMVIKLSAAMDG